MSLSQRLGVPGKRPTFLTSSGFPVLLYVALDHGDPAPSLSCGLQLRVLAQLGQSLHFPPPERLWLAQLILLSPATEVKGHYGQLDGPLLDQMPTLVEQLWHSYQNHGAQNRLEQQGRCGGAETLKKG